MFRSTSYGILQDLARRVIRTRRTYNWARRVALAGSYLSRIPHEQDFGFFAAFPELKGPIVDVGANGGQSIVSFSIFCRRAKILSFEPNPELHGELRFVFRWLNRNGSKLIPVALGESDGMTILRIPYRGALPIDARASILAGTAAGDDEPDGATRSVDVEIRAFDRLSAGELGTDDDPEVIKIDVEGHEAQVVRGMRAMLARAQPLIMFERSESFEDVERELMALGYQLFDFDPERRLLKEWRADAGGTNLFALSPPWRETCRAKGLIAA